MRENLNDNDLHELCLRWAAWCRSRRYLGAPRVPPGILARMQPGPVRDVPDAQMSPQLSLFNTAVSAQPDSPAKISFLIFYLHPARCVKEAAAAQEVSRDGFYRRVRRFRRKAYRAMVALETANAGTWVRHSVTWGEPSRAAVHC
ncbi:hypothetical protein F6X40_19950 [Paraburkholderia sp. UCT31]|uniref:hypothetical protein n=1 Tax=Paraburkholderia sp. UCT31 TaxID=2615209 RepID=UPI001655BA34|nr:hypothetical protein [Paraburkholderia sp. UCT31]MBC8739030.1 hypothetical protein [Paraburkholderia sp. UCT31]